MADRKEEINPVRDPSRPWCDGRRLRRLISNGVKLRKATVSDIEFLWYLRNQPDVYRYARKAREVSWQEHINWIFPILLGEKNTDLFMIEVEEVPAGQIRFDYEKGCAEVSISILNNFRGKGVAGRALLLAIEKIKKQNKAKKIKAEIHQENLASLRFFEKLGFELKGKRDYWMDYYFNP